MVQMNLFPRQADVKSRHVDMAGWDWGVGGAGKWRVG